MTDPLLAACRLVAHAIGATVTPPTRTGADTSGLQAVADVGRASQLRTRQILLRAGWWRQEAGPLVAWHGEERRPVALLPVSKRVTRGYEMVDAATGNRRRVSAALADEISVDAAMFYRSLPAHPLNTSDLLSFLKGVVAGDAMRILLAVAGLSLLALVGPVLMGVVVNGAIPDGDHGQLTLCVIALIGVAIGSAGFQAAQGIAVVRLSGIFDWQVQAALMDRLLALPPAFFRRFSVGDLTNRTLAIEGIRQILTGRVVGGLLAGVGCVCALGLMVWYSGRLALIALLLLAIHAAAILIANLVVFRHVRQQAEAAGRVEGLVLQFLSAIGKLRIAGAVTRALLVWSDEFARLKHHSLTARRASALLTAFEAGYSTLASLIIFASMQGAGHAVNPGQFVAFFIAFGQASAAISGFAAAVGEALSVIPAFDRLRPLLREAREVIVGSKSPGALTGAVELRDVSFRYHSATPLILDGVSLRVRSGEYVALVGGSGSGKSTLFRLLLGFETPHLGSVIYDDQALDTLDLGAVRRQIGVVLQNGALMTGSLYDNICGGLQLPVEQVLEAAAHAGLAADIEAMPMGVHTVVAEGMGGLSGGQRQRLMIARALVQRPRILLFDEATSALDNRTQAVVTESLGRLNVTRVVIAHRLSTIRDADRIVVLAGGRIVQDGAFEALAGVPGPFADLAKRQLI